jgi:Ser/Thr protein kinase RdoA (MazF antagonist)
MTARDPQGRPARDVALAAWLDPAAATLAPLGDGHINDTWLVTTPGRRLVLQRVNERVFPEPRALMRKVVAVLRHIELGRGAVAVPALVPTRRGEPCCDLGADGLWRLWQYQEGTRTLPQLDNAAQARAAAWTFGSFQLALRDLPGEVPDPIPGFLQLGHYLARLDAALTACEPEAAAAEVVRAVTTRRDLATLFGDRDRLIHGDCKVDNVLFHARRDEVACVIDLDTVMWGHWAWDFGDLVRSAAATRGARAAEFSLERFGAAVGGFVGCGAIGRDVDALVLAPRYVGLMLAVRFLTDHLEGDRYFRVRARGENLRRARQQLALVAAMEGLEPEMRRTAARA